MKNENKPAYPIAVSERTDTSFMEPGLSKLEAFTMAAMQGICANHYYTYESPIDSHAGGVASTALAQAKATLKLLEDEK